MNSINIGQLIRERMATIGMTQIEFAEIVGKTRQTVASMLESDNIDVKTLQVASDALDFDFFTYYVKGGRELGNLESSPVSISLNVPANAVGDVLKMAFGDFNGKVLLTHLPGKYHKP